MSVAAIYADETLACASPERPRRRLLAQSPDISGERGPSLTVAKPFAGNINLSADDARGPVHANGLGHRGGHT